jgi:hypothetical protein
MVKSNTSSQKKTGGLVTFKENINKNQHVCTNKTGHQVYSYQAFK